MFFKSGKSAGATDTKTMAPAKSNETESASPDTAEAPAAAKGTAPDAKTPVHRRRLAAKAAAAGFGEIVAVFMRSPNHKHLKIEELEARVLPAVVRGQYVVAEAHTKTEGAMGPVAAVLWAMVSPEVDARLSTTKGRPLKAVEWRSGSIPWVMEAVGDRKSLAAILKRLQMREFNGLAPKLFLKDGKTGAASVGTVSAISRPTS
jgi:cytolysin-activating lysine-acyltransferase